jgi:small conductance mechanosensitive channel
VFGIGYDDNIRHATDVLMEVAGEHKLVLDEPPVMVNVDELADSSVNLLCRPWVKTKDYWAVRWDLTRQVKERFDAEGISIPFPQRDVHMHPESVST